MNGSVLFQAKNVNKKIGKIPILQDINLDIYKEENTAIIGNNGSGKSSLIKLIAESMNRLVELSKGQVLK